MGVHFTHKYRRYSILQKVYNLYNCTYSTLLASLGIYIFSTSLLLEFVTQMVTSPVFWINFVAKMALCNVVISDMLYMAIF